MMKRLNIIILTLLTLVVTIGCNKTEDAYITPSEKSIALESDASDITFTVSSNVEWKMKVSDHWFKITPKVGEGKTEVRLVAERNVTGVERTSVLEFSDGGSLVERVQVSQPAFVVNMGVECPESVTVKKGESLALTLTEPADDWEYTVKNGDWLKEFSKTQSKLIFQLNPGVKFDESVPAEIEFTSPSDPAFYAKATVKPVNYFHFSATVPESIDLGVRGCQLKINVDANFDWTYTIKNGSWLEKYDQTSNLLVFDGKLAKLLKSDAAEITFTSPDYANFSYTASVLPIAPVTNELVDKSTLKPIVLIGDSQWDAGTEQYLFDGAWTIYRNNYYTYKDGDPTKPTGIGYKAFSFGMNGYKIQDHPMTFTIDAGERINLSKFVTYHYYQFESQTPLTYDIYAYKTNGTPKGNEPLGTELFEGEEGWVKIGSVNNIGKILEYEAKYKTGDYFDELAQGDIISIDEDNSFPARYYRFAMTGNGYWWYAVKADETGISRNKQSWGIPWEWLGWCTISEISLYKYIDY